MHSMEKKFRVAIMICVLLLSVKLESQSPMQIEPYSESSISLGVQWLFHSFRSISDRDSSK